MSNFVNKPLIKGSHGGGKDDDFHNVSAEKLKVSGKLEFTKNAKIFFTNKDGASKELSISTLATKSNVKTQVAASEQAVSSHITAALPSALTAALPAAFATATGAAAIGSAINSGTGATAVTNVVAPLIAPLNFTMITTNDYQLVKGNYILSADQYGNKEVTTPTLPTPIAGTVITIYGPYAYTLVLNDGKVAAIATGIIVCFAISNTKWEVFNMPGTTATFS